MALLSFWHVDFPQFFTYYNMAFRINAKKNVIECVWGAALCNTNSIIGLPKAWLGFVGGRP